MAGARGALKKVHYACGPRLLPGWLNVDARKQCVLHGGAVFLPVDLTQPHPFADDSFSYGYAEDFLEHLEQEQSLRFLCEVFRTLRPEGVVRLSFPGLEGVLVKHYAPPCYRSAAAAFSDAYMAHGHRHFYCRDELRLVALHIGFRHVHFESHGVSAHRELSGIDSREEQRTLNTYVELTK